MKNKIYIIHENDERIEPPRKELQDLGIEISEKEWNRVKKNFIQKMR